MKKLITLAIAATTIGFQGPPGTSTSPEQCNPERYGGNWALHRSVVELSKPSRKIPWEPTGLASPS